MTQAHAHVKPSPLRKGSTDVVEVLTLNTSTVSSNASSIDLDASFDNEVQYMLQRNAKHNLCLTEGTHQG